MAIASRRSTTFYWNNIIAAQLAAKPLISWTGSSSLCLLFQDRSGYFVWSRFQDAFNEVSILMQFASTWLERSFWLVVTNTIWLIRKDDEKLIKLVTLAMLILKRKKQTNSQNSKSIENKIERPQNREFSNQTLLLVNSVWLANSLSNLWFHISSLLILGM